MKGVDQEEIARRRGIYFQGFGIYGGLSGLFDFGPYGSRMKDKIVRTWKETMLSEGNIAEFDGTTITHTQVLKASGHYDRFFDFSVECKKCGTKYRADDLVEKRGVKVTLDRDWLQSKITELGIKCEKCNGDLGEVRIQKLMFQVDQGEGSEPLFLRPETAQGMFINFKEYYRFFREKLPFAIVTVGRGYRNEISPRRALYRLREFNMMECESFFDPQNEKWVHDPEDSISVTFLTNDGKELKATPKEAYDKGIVKSHPMAYFMGLALRFYSAVGIDIGRIRFRQHRKEELSHYSSETWDAESLTDLGWIEVTGIAHRGTFDLANHIKASGKDLYAQRVIPRKEVIEKKKEIDYQTIKAEFPEQSSKIIAAMKDGASSLSIEGKNIDIGRFLVEKEEKVVVDRENFIPVVIEPAFGLDRIIYTILDHNLSVREDSGYVCLKVPYSISPYDAAILPLMAKDGLDVKANSIFENLLKQKFSVLYDDSGSIGKRYSRYDEVGILYCITVDYDTLKNGDVTIRHRDTRVQIRIKIDEIPDYLGRNPWNGK
ncbi:MAG: glycine--tRNA ligase [Candidatus Thermoplasmatota archaeon]|nr:glycine--tRNA ligase [Candidatus Thermoplasmatota archaeon]